MQVQEAVFRDENTLIRVQFVELTVKELFTKSIDVWVLRENTASTSLSFIDQIWNLLSGKAQHQVRMYLLFVAFAFGICSQREHLFDKKLL